jgi:hypothetical protein
VSILCDGVPVTVRIGPSILLFPDAAIPLVCTSK